MIFNKDTHKKCKYSWGDNHGSFKLRTDLLQSRQAILKPLVEADARSNNIVTSRVVCTLCFFMFGSLTTYSFSVVWMRILAYYVRSGKRLEAIQMSCLHPRLLQNTRVRYSLDFRSYNYKGRRLTKQTLNGNFPPSIATYGGIDNTADRKLDSW